MNRLQNLAMVGCLLSSWSLSGAGTVMAWPALPVGSIFSPDELDSQLELAGDNRGQLEQSLRDCPAEQQEAMRFLIQHMPPRDLQTLTAKFLLEHVAIAFEAKSAAKWGASIPDDIFFNEVLPYANVNEPRDDVRRKLRDQFWPAVKGMDSISQAAARLNHEVFQQTGVHYSTKRRRPDQGPQETMDNKTASCTGLSILLIDACRACGIPARFVGTPRWSDNSGNHSWIEVWDNGWHYTGAAEPTGDQLNQAWFTDRAALATVGDQQHGIFAVSYRRTDQKFPLVWQRGENHVHAVDVTERYAAKRERPAGTIDVRFKALAPGQPQRCRANLLIKDEHGEVVFRGQTLDESADSNHHLTTTLKPGRYQLEVTLSGSTTTQEFVAEQDGQLVTVQTTALDPALQALQALQAWCDAEEATRGTLAEQPFANTPLNKTQTEQARQILVAEHQRRLRAQREAEHQGKLLSMGDLKMPYEVRVFGEQPASGHSLYVSMHGGGGAPKRVNDQQWKNQQRLYELEEGVYVAPRAPTDTWNLWHQDHIDALFARLIENMIVFEGIDPNRVYITGYSAGGDGVYQLAPRMADRLAAAAMMAGHPNETQPLGLRNLPFTLHMGELDAAYDRNKIAQQWSEQLASLQQADPQGYIHWAKIHAGKGHWMDRGDAEGVKWMAQYSRNMIPDRVVWLQDDVMHQRFYWLSVGNQPPREREKVVARRSGQKIEIESSDRTNFAVLLRDDMLDLDAEITIVSGDRVLFQGQAPRTIANLAKTLSDRGDPTATFSAQVDVQF
ncbi:MAG: transglutaminase domain-containing protein [Pirellulaceae bacterium]|nr:transglutaminase domain-containing protein [Pirellulaceae bacterium]